MIISQLPLTDRPVDMSTSAHLSAGDDDMNNCESDDVAHVSKLQVNDMNDELLLGVENEGGVQCAEQSEQIGLMSANQTSYYYATSDRMSLLVVGKSVKITQTGGRFEINHYTLP